jgi:hypothetical protein
MRTGVNLTIGGAELLRTRAAICGSCRHHRDARCSVSGLALVLHVHGLECPKNKQADRRGWVRWMLAWWVGVPRPKRVWRFMRTRNRGWLGLPGCGCVVALKRLVSRVRG